MSLRPTTFEETFKMLAALGAVLSFLWGVWVWRDNSAKQREHSRQESAELAASRRIEATKPFLERQLRLYTEASQVAATIATGEPGTPGYEKNLKRFWELYWGELALVENRQVEAAMVNLGRAIDTAADKNELNQLSLKLTQACRQSLDKSWGINAWSNPDEAANVAATP